MKTGKFLLLLPLLLSGAAQASTPGAWEIWSYWSVDELYVIFNGIASIMRSAGFASLSKATMLFGLAVMLFVSMNLKSFAVVQWTLNSMLIFMLVNMPVATVAIIDKTGSQPPKLVSNVPVLLAATASTITTAGGWLTETFEASYSLLPSYAAGWESMKFSKNDLGFGHRLLKESRQMRIADPILQADMIYFTRDCINAGLAEGSLDFSRIFTGNTPNDTWTYIKDNVNPARMTSYHSADGTLKVGYCDEVAKGTGGNVTSADSLNARLTTAIAAAQQHYGQKINPADLTGSIFATHLQHAYGVMLNASMGASEIIKQNMFLNLYSDSQGAIGQMMGDPAAVTAAYAKAQAIATANSSYTAMARVAEQTMPKIRNGLEMMIYALFPVITIFMIVAGHQSWPFLKGYIMGLVWVNLWPPIYAVVNFIGTFTTAKSLLSQTTSLGGGGGLSIQTADMIAGTAISDQALMGYMVALVPFIALAVTKGGEMAMTSVAQNWITPGQAAAQSAASTAALGNMNQGNMKMDTANANKVDMTGSYAEPTSYKATDAFGNTHKFDAANTATQQNLSSLASNVNFAQGISSALKLTQNESAGNATKYGTEGAAQISSGASEAWDYAKKHAKGTDASTDWRYGDRLSDEDKVSRAVNFSEKFSAGHGVKASDAFTAMANIGAGIGYGQYAARMSAAGKTDAMDEKTYSNLREAMQKAEIANVAGVTADWARGHGLKTGDSDAQQGGHGFVAKLDQGVSLTRKATEERSKAESASRAIEFAETNAGSINSNLSQQVANRMRAKGMRVGDGGAADVANQEVVAKEVIQERAQEMMAGKRPDFIPDSEATGPAPTPGSIVANLDKYREQASRRDGTPSSENDVRENAAANAQAIKRQQSAAGVAPGTPTQHAALEGRVNTKVDSASQEMQAQQTGIHAATRQTEGEVRAEQKRHEGPGGTASVVAQNTVGDPLANARAKGFLAEDTKPRVSGEGYDRFKDAGYDPAKAARNPMGMYNPDQVRQAREDLELPQYKGKR
jgi:conjugal transfer mating pair stabilization protein TraG